jgi:predicted permease
LERGAQFEFSAIPHLKREIISGIILRSVIVPLLGIGVAYLAFRHNFSGPQFAALVAVFCTPVAVSSVPMAQEMGADAELAGQLVVFTTITSAFTVFIASFLLKAAGIF